MNINEAIKSLVLYGIKKQLFSEEDITFVTNRILETVKLDGFGDCEATGRRRAGEFA